MRNTKNESAVSMLNGEARQLVEPHLAEKRQLQRSVANLCNICTAAVGFHGTWMQKKIFTFYVRLCTSIGSRVVTHVHSSGLEVIAKRRIFVFSLCAILLCFFVLIHKACLCKRIDVVQHRASASSGDRFYRAFS